jgi:5-methylthioadenosine/S-adenosylhomocysteine deaminase
LEAGKAADLALVDLSDSRFLPRYDVVSLLVYAVKAGDVTDTIVNGRVLMRDRHLLTLDEGALRAEVEPYRRQVLESLGRGEETP